MNLNELQAKNLNSGAEKFDLHKLKYFISKVSKNYSEQLHEIKYSFQVLTEMGVMETKTYCHPYGGFFSFNADTLSLLKDEGVLYSFNVESRDIEASDFINSMQYLPRYDCNLFEHGKAS